MLNLYTETAFQVTPATAASVIQISIPRKNGSYDKSKFSSLRNNDARAFTKDEQTFASHILASQSSIHTRRSATHPRTFYWKVVNKGRVLEVRCADLARNETDLREAYYTLRFEFQDDIIPRGVTFADLESSDEIHAFVCTKKNEIFNLRLPAVAFRDPNYLQVEPLNQFCKPLESSALGIDTVHHVYASSPLVVFISFASGKVQRLTRRSGHEVWQQDNYDDRTWGASLRGIVTRRGLHMIEYGSTQLDPRTVQTMTASPDGSFLFTVCLNHTLRVWNLHNGKIIATKDLLDAERDPNDRTHLNPAEDALLQLFQFPLQKYPVLLTYTPQDGGQFKFWDIRGSLTDSIVVEDKYPGVVFNSPDPDPSGNTLWTMAGFKLDPGNETTPARLWVLCRNHNHHQLYNCQFEFGDIANSWKSNWVKCSARSSMKSPAPDFVKTDQQDPASKWVDFFFYPGRYSEAALETALSMLEEVTSVKLTSSQKNASLKQRMCTVVAAGVSLRKYEELDLDFDRFSTDVDSNWRHLHRIAETINESRNAPLALAFDTEADMVWIAMADKCCAVRECSKIDLLEQNEFADIRDLEDVTARTWPYRKVSSDDGESFSDLFVLISAARRFRESFPADIAQDLSLAIEEDMSTSAEYVASTRIFEIYDSVGFTEAISNEVFEQLESDLSTVGGLSALTNELFIGVLELLVVRSKRAKTALRNTLFGNLLLSAGMLDMISSQHQLLSDLLVLSIFVEGELNQEEAKMTAFDAAELFQHILPPLRLCNRNLWLASHTRAVPIEIMGADGHPNAARHAPSQNMEDSRIVTIFEDTLSKAVRPRHAADRPLMYLIMDQLSEIDDWASGKDTIDTEDGAVFLQCDLLKQGELDLASDFLRFQPSTSWSSYVKGRLAVEKGEYDIAAHYFQKASYGLACGKAIGNLVALSAGLLSIIEAECFNNGLALYLHHITNLFDSSKAYNEAARFAHLTLQALPTGQKEPLPNFRVEVLSRLFNAELKQFRLESAFNALVQLSDPALQRSCVHAIINTILDSKSSISGAHGAVHVLQSLPWAMYPQLARYMDDFLVSLAKHQTFSESNPSGWPSRGDQLDNLSIVHAIRVSQKDYRGAMTILYDRLRWVRRSGRARHDPQATALRQTLLALINVMACVRPEEAYILADAAPNPIQSEANDQSNAHGDADTLKKRRRIIITLDDLRKEYQAALDRCSRIERGDFDFEVDEEDSDDGEAGLDVDRSRLNLNTQASDAMEL